MGLSVNTFTYAGEDEFDLNFAASYSSRSDVACWNNGPTTDPFDTPVSVTFDFITDHRVVVTDPVSIGDELVFTRTVSKTDLPVDLTVPGNLTREGIEAGLRHAMYISHEVLDGRIEDSLPVQSAVASLIETGVSNALDQLVTEVSFVFDVVLRPDFTSAGEVVGYVATDREVSSEDVLVYVHTPPTSTTEFLISSGGTVKFSVTLDSAGNEVSRSSGTVTLQAGALSASVSGGVYNSGADIDIVVPAVVAGTADIISASPDFVDIFETARNAP